jgi:hypothetical protein
MSRAPRIVDLGPAPAYRDDLILKPLYKDDRDTVWASPRGGHLRPRLLCYLKSHTPLFIVTKGAKTTFTTHCADCAHTKKKVI